MKKYMNPTIRLHDVKATNVISTSDIPLGEDIDSGTTDAPQRNKGGEWSDYSG